MSATPAIVVVQPGSGRFEEAVTEVDGEVLRSPNDLCISPAGELFFTDPGEFDRDAGVPGWICRVAPGGATVAVHLQNVYPNGIAFSAAGILTWVESITGNVMTYQDGVAHVVANLGPDAIPDGCAYTDDGRLVIAAFDRSGLAIVDWRSGIPAVEMLTWAEEVRATNVAFDGSILWVTDAGPRSDTTLTSGRLWRLTTSLQGRQLDR
jgi:sugar lactone lactonase YvrE